MLCVHPAVVALRRFVCRNLVSEAPATSAHTSPREVASGEPTTQGARKRPSPHAVVHPHALLLMRTSPPSCDQASLLALRRVSVHHTLVKPPSRLKYPPPPTTWHSRQTKRLFGSSIRRTTTPWHTSRLGQSSASVSVMQIVTPETVIRLANCLVRHKQTHASETMVEGEDDNAGALR